MFERMDMDKAFGIEKGDIISLVGAGGKTTIMKSLANYLKSSGKVLITTSTKFRLRDGDCDILYTNIDDYKSPNTENTIVGLVDGPNPQNKHLAIGDDVLRAVAGDFDYIVIEADGSRRLPFKMWKAHEPVIYSCSNITIGVFPLHVYGKVADENTVYNYERYREIVDSSIIDENSFLAMISRPDAMFKDSKGRKIFYLNCVESGEDLELAKDIISYLAKNTSGIDFVLGSSISGIYYKYNR